MKKVIAFGLAAAGAVMAISSAQAAEINTAHTGTIMSKGNSAPVLSSDQLLGDHTAELRRSGRGFRGRHFRSGRHFKGRHFRNNRSNRRHFRGSQSFQQTPFQGPVFWSS